VADRDTTTDIAGANARHNRRPLVGRAERAPALSVMIRLNVVAPDEGLRQDGVPSFAMLLTSLGCIRLRKRE